MGEYIQASTTENNFDNEGFCRFGAVIEEGEVEEVLGMIFSVKDGGGLIKSDLSRWHN